MNGVPDPSRPGPATTYVVRVRPGDAAPPAAQVGGKAHNLARLAATGTAVPPWVVVTADAFRNFVVDRFGLPAVEEVPGWQARVREEGVPPELARQLAEAVAAAGLGDARLAVRSSALGEDGSAASFAGQFDTRLGVRIEGLETAVAEVWASAFNAHALAYGGRVTGMAVIIQEMVDARVAGVAFGVDPVSGDPDTAVVSAVWGLGEGLVSGALDADTYRVDFTREGAVSELTPVQKTEWIRMLPDGGSVREPLPPHLRSIVATLPNERAVEIARQTRAVGDAFGAPQDVEWAIAAGSDRLYLLQARPITTLQWTQRGERRVWDNSNIVESYSGITSPLTFSFARSVYDDVYRQFCAVVGVPAPLIDRHRHVFANMLGLVRGRVYYNLLNWYRTLALLPGYSVNRGFMERMMGVRDKLQDPPVLEATSRRGADAVRMTRMVARLIRQSRGLRSAVPAFHARVERALAPLADEDLTSWSPDRLARLYRDLEEELLRNWQTPLVNDFFAMIWFGVLGRLVESWLPDAPPTLANDLLTHEGGIISAEPARLVREMARRAASEPAVAAIFRGERDAQRVRRRLVDEPTAAGFLADVESYLARFGDRCINELKLETVTLREDPDFLFETIRGYLAVEAGEGGPPEGATAPPSAREEAEARVARTLGGMRRGVFGAVLAQTRRRVRDRENLRFERTRVFGVVRRIFVGLGEQLTRAGHLEDQRDIFFLRVEEIFGHVEGTMAGADLRALVGVRRAEWEVYDRLPPPPDRFESFGPVADGRWILPPSSAPAAGNGAALTGIGCCPGVVRAPVRLVREPRDAGDLAGHILVAERTDPGWTLLFPAARGLLVERGSLLSHSAIVAREMALPCIVSIPALMATLRDGEMVEMDGATGTVRRLDV